MTVRWVNVDGILYQLSGTISLESKTTLWLVTVIFSDFNKRSSSATVLNYFYVMYQRSSSIEHISLSFSSNFFTYQLDFSVF